MQQQYAQPQQPRQQQQQQQQQRQAQPKKGKRGEQTAARSSTVDPNTSVLQQVGSTRKAFGWFVDGRGSQLFQCVLAKTLWEHMEQWNNPIFLGGSWTVFTEANLLFQSTSSTKKSGGINMYEPLADTNSNYMGDSKNSGTPKSSHFNRVFHHKPSILRYPYFWKQPYVYLVPWTFTLLHLLVLFVDVNLFERAACDGGWTSTSMGRRRRSVAWIWQGYHGLPNGFVGVSLVFTCFYYPKCGIFGKKTGEMMLILKMW